MTQKSRLPKALSRGGGDGINVNPLQRGGRLYPEARQVLHEWGDGYSVCDFCDGRLDSIKKPPLADFIHNTLPAFLDTDVARVTNGAREAIFTVMHAMCSAGDTVIIDQNAHYTTYVAAERNNLIIKEVSHSGYPAFSINPDAYAEAITSVKTDSGQLPQLIVLTYPDGNYGNLVTAQKVAQIANEFNIPLLLNAAYAVGRMPLSARRIGCDFIVGSGHKSMAASGPIGVLGLRDEYRDRILRVSRYAKAKEVELLGCTARGATIMTLLASFPHVVERTQAWDQEVNQARWFIRELEQSGFFQLGQRPHNHDLMFLEALPFYTISQKHPKKRFFLYQALKQRGIFGIKAGLTKHFKLSTYQLTHEEVTIILQAFREILDENRKYL